MAYHADVRILRISLPFQHDHAFSVKIQGICNVQIPCITLHIVFVSPKLISLYVLELECYVIATQRDSNNMHSCGDSTKPGLWTLDSGLDCGLDSGLNNGLLDSRLEFWLPGVKGHMYAEFATKVYSLTLYWLEYRVSIYLYIYSCRSHNDVRAFHSYIIMHALTPLCVIMCSW